MKNPTFATAWNADLIEQYYQRWLDAPSSLEAHWQAFFEGFELGQSQEPGDRKSGVIDVELHSIKQARVIGAIYAYRSIGHTQARYNPLLDTDPVNHRLLLDRLGFTESDLDDAYHTGNYLGGTMMSVRDILHKLRETYCGSIGVEYLHIQETPKRRWLQSRMEPHANRHEYSREKKLRILRKISEGEIFEQFLHTRYVGQKRFSLEGGETAIAALDALIEKCPSCGVEEVIMGMAHRGRLNVLANILGKSYAFIFREFSENYIPDTIHGDGDVKYHLGYETVRKTLHGQTVELHLAANPSHLEAVNPVVQGKTRARQRLRNDPERKKVLPLLIHGDAAMSGQGITAETFNLAKLKGYRTGGTIHLIINNQIGFTTDPTDSRSSFYCTDIAKVIDAPVFHVNGDDPLAVVYCMELALDYRQQFGEDVVVDMYCYRRHGHNEADEPGFTQPTLYNKLLKNHPAISAQLAKRLIREGTLSLDEVKALKQEYQEALDSAFEGVKKAEAEAPKKARNKFAGSTAVFQPTYTFEPVQTAVPVEMLKQVGRQLTQWPASFNINPKIQRQLETKRRNLETGVDMDWAFAEALAFGTLLHEGIPVRLSGQDCERGTFSQRHAVLLDTESLERYTPLNNLHPEQAQFCVHNSSLSEAAVLGFDYGYSVDYPRMLCLWEAQFGDFANGAQVIIDQFITSCESKWQRVSGIVMLLPHGQEGQGPEHSSARLERFLQAAAEDNIQVCNLTTPAQYFHVLRRQMKQPYRKPLIIMSPKSLLRHKECVSTCDDFTQKTFQPILEDPEPAAKPTRLILCSGKVYYDLLAFRRENKLPHATILRIEQLYPLDKKRLQELFKAHAPASGKLIWCQEESRNMGAWTYLSPLLEELSGHRPIYVGRKASASPAVGSLALHRMEQAHLVEQAFSI